ncbi:MAG: PEP-CTERM sorting domain-containing protein [Luteolibacter sp.]
MKLKVLTLFAMVFSQLPSAAISITIEYVTPGDSFFTAQAQSTLSKAALDISNAITTSLNPLAEDRYTGTSGLNSATADWAAAFTNPNTGVLDNSVSDFSNGADEIILKVGHRDLDGSTLGVGGTAASLGFSFSESDSSFSSAVAEMEAASNVGLLRGGIVNGTFSGTLGSETYNLEYGYAVGSLAFDSLASWHFDYDTLPGAGQNDFYSVAVHEILHTLGVGGGDTWDSNISGTDWTGAEVIAALGSGTDVIEADGNHIAQNVMGFAIIDGVQTNISQEVVMDPNITTGTRKYLTDVDLAFLTDMGWTTTAIPEPSSLALFGLSFAGLLVLRRR